MNCLTIFVEKAKVLMDTLKPQQPDDTMQGILLDVESTELVAGKVVMTPNGHEDAREEEVHKEEQSSV
jgi:hypothetical protein